MEQKALIPLSELRFVIPRQRYLFTVAQHYAIEKEGVYVVHIYCEALLYSQEYSVVKKSAECRSEERRVGKECL